MPYLLTSLDGSQTHDATTLLGPGCHRRLATGHTYPTIKLEEIAHKKLPELKGHKRWRFGVQDISTA